MATQPQVQTVNTGADKAKLSCAILLTVGAFVVHFVLAGRGTQDWIQWLALLGMLLLAAGAFLMSSWGRQFVAYCKDSVKEVKKVVWPAPKEAMQMTGYVFLFVTIMAILLWIADRLLEWGIFGVILGWR